MTVVEDFKVIKQALDRFRPAEVPLVVNPLAFQAAKEAFRNGIIVAITFPAHAANDAMLFENFLIIGRRILTATVRMV